MKKLLYNPKQIITVDTQGKNYKRGAEQSSLGILTNHSILIEDDLIAGILPNNSLNQNDVINSIDLTGKTVLPGLIECHTHLVFAGSRSSEFFQRLKGKSYEEIARAGGGINNTVEAVRKSSFDELVNSAKSKVEYFISQGVTSLEIKSGYGLSYYDEIKLLQVIKHLNEIYDIDIAATFLGAHTFPKEYKNDKKKYLEIIINEMLPYIAENNLAEFCDAFCEVTAFSAKEVDSIFNAAEKYNLKLKLHTEQFNSVGGLETALAHGAISVDHLEVLNDDQIKYFSATESVAALLPGVSYFLDYNFAPAKKMIANDAIIALATDFNPGSSNISNISFIMNLAAIKMKMSAEEIISAYTINAAKAINREKISGSIEVGKQADFSIFDSDNYLDIIYNAANNLNSMTIKKGKVIYTR